MTDQAANPVSSDREQPIVGRAVNPPSYAYIFEDGSVGVSYSPPAAGDLAAINNGILQVLCWTTHGIAEIDEDGELCKLRDLELIDGEYHS